MTADPYVYPGTRVLRNLPGITDFDELQRVEARVTLATSLDLALQPERGDFDLAHLQRIHRRLFAPLYSWAGQLRTIDISKDNALFCRPQLIEQFAGDVFGKIPRGAALDQLTPEQTLHRLPQHLSDIDALHPFREGNGRATRAFIGQWAEAGGIHLDWSRLDRDRNVLAYQAAFRGNAGPLRDLVHEVAEPISRSPHRGPELGR